MANTVRKASGPSGEDEKPLDDNHDENRVHSHLYCLVTGAIMGVSELIPGVSAGTIALLAGLYYRLIKAVSGLLPATLDFFKHKDVKKFTHESDFIFMATLGIGMVVVVLSLASYITFVYGEYPIRLYSFFFAVCITAGIFLLRDLEIEHKSPQELYVLGGGLLLGVLMAIVTYYAPGVQLPVNPVTCLIIGAIAVSAMMLPGVSGSFLMLATGFYFPIIAALNNQDFWLLIPFVIGGLAGAVLFSKLLEMLFEPKKTWLLLFLCGFMIGATLKLWPTVALQDQGDMIATAYAFIAAYCVLGVAVVVGVRYMVRGRNLFNAHPLSSIAIIGLVAVLMQSPPAAAQSAAQATYHAEAERPVTHIVKSGDTLTTIASKYGMSVSLLATINALSDVHSLKVGQTLKLVSLPRIYHVHEGDSLSTIAQQFGMATRTLAAYNQIASPYKIVVGQEIILRPTLVKAHTVKRGESLYSIAKLYELTVQELQLHNKLDSDIVTIQPGDVLQLQPAEIHKVHRVKRGDTVSAIVRLYGADFKELIKINKLKSPFIIQPGTVIKLPEDISAPSQDDLAQEERRRQFKKQYSRSCDLGTSRPLHMYWPLETRGSIVKSFRDTMRSVEITAAEGSVVKAIAEGVVSYAGDGLLRDLGWLVIIRHGGEMISAYAYNQQVLVAEDECVSAGQPVARVGRIDQEQSRLHFELIRKGKAVNPRQFLE